MASSVVLWQEAPLRYQARVDGVDGLPLCLSATEAVYMVQFAHRLLGREQPDFGESLTQEQRQRVETLTRGFLKHRQLIDA